MNRFLSLLIAFLLAGTSTLVPAARADESPTKPILRIETGMHIASIWQISVDAAGKYVATASFDKTVRVWDAASGRLLQTLRPPIAEGNEGKLSAVALSPDGRTVACAGNTGYAWDEANSIYLFDRASGQMLQRLAGLPEVISHLAYAPDGSRLAAVLVGKNGVRVYRTSDFSLVGEDKAYDDGSYGVDFDHAGRLVTTCDDGFVRLYDASLHLLHKVTAPSGTQPGNIRFSPEGTRLAMGYADKSRVDVLSASDLSLLYAPDVHLADNGSLSKVAWSADGRFLYAGGRYQANSDHFLLYWSQAGQGIPHLLSTGSNNALFDLQPRKGGGVWFASGGSTWGGLNADGKALLHQVPQTADFRNNLAGFLLAGDATTVCFGYQPFGKSPARLDIPTRSLRLEPSAQAAQQGRPPLTVAPDLNITDWEDNTAPKLNGKPLLLLQYEFSRSLAIESDWQRFVLGTEWYVRCFNAQGKELWNVPASGATWDVNISGNGKVCAATFNDGTIRWYRMSDGKELLAFFPHADKQRWVLWTPSGFYDCSPGGEDLFGWHLNRGKAQAADFFPASRFRDVFYRPDVIAHVLDTLDEDEAVRLANLGGKKTQAVEVAKILPPIIRLVTPADQTDATSTTLTLKYALRAPSREPITDIKALVDGRPISEARKFEEVPATDGKDKETFREITLTLPARDCVVSLLAFNKYAASVPATLRVTWKGQNPDDVAHLKPRLYILAIGAGQYLDPNVRPKLTYPAKDAADFAAKMALQKGLLYRDVTVRTLTEEKATKEAILEGLDWIQKETTSKDVAMVFLSGHGFRDRSGDYYFLPIDYVAGKNRSTGIPFYEIQKTVTSLAGKALFFVDTCHSGFSLGDPGKRAKGDSSDINAVVNELASVENGAVVFAASTGKEEALEDDEWQNGAFTKALLEGLSGKADVRHSGRITITMLEFYISERVKELTKGAQHPTMRKPDVVPDFPLAITP